MSWCFPGCGGFLFVFLCVRGPHCWACCCAFGWVKRVSKINKLRLYMALYYWLISSTSIGFLKPYFFILFFSVSPYNRQFPGSWHLSLVLFVKLSPSGFFLFWRYLFTIFPCIDSIHWLLKYFSFPPFFFIFFWSEKRVSKHNHFSQWNNLFSMYFFFLKKILIIDNQK